MLKQVAALEHTGTASHGSVTNMTNSMAYALLTLDLEQKEDQKQIREKLYGAIEKINIDMSVAASVSSGMNTALLS